VFRIFTILYFPKIFLTFSNLLYKITTTTEIDLTLTWSSKKSYIIMLLLVKSIHFISVLILSALPIAQKARLPLTGSKNRAPVQVKHTFFTILSDADKHLRNIKKIKTQLFSACGKRKKKCFLILEDESLLILLP
jgi:hypothetical protein